MTPERRINEHVHKKITIPHFYYKISDRFTRGIPDSLIINEEGKQLWIEFKIYPNKPSPLQSDKIDELIRHNQDVWIVTAKLSSKPYSYTINKITNLQIVETTTPWVDITEFLS